MESNLEPLLKFCDEKGKWGYRNLTGETIIQPQYDAADFFYDAMDVTVVQKGNSYIIIDRAGGPVDNEEYDSYVMPFYENMICVSKNRAYSYIDGKGKMIAPQVFDEAYRFSEGLASVKKDGLYGYLDITGKTKIEFRYTYAGIFKENLASVTEGFLKAFFINSEGKAALNHNYDAAQNFSQGLASVCKEKKHGYIDKTGKLIIDILYDAAGDFSEGLAAVRVKDKWGYIDAGGSMIIEPQFSIPGVFCAGAAVVSISSAEKKSGIINQTGKFITALQSAPIPVFSENLTVITLMEKQGYVDNCGRVVIEPKYLSGKPFFQGTAMVILDKLDSGMVMAGYVDKNDNLLWKFTAPRKSL